MNSKRTKTEFKGSAKVARIAEAPVAGKEELLYFDEEVYKNLPKCLQAFFQFSGRRENDMFLNALLPALGLTLHNVSGMYDGRIVYPTLYSINCAPAASGKGVQNLINNFLLIIGKHIAEHHRDKIQVETLLCPGNSSASALFQFLGRNKLAMINETEIDTISTAISNEWGDYTASLRQAYHHETITINRIESGLHFIENPRLSVSFAGTQDQFINLFKNTENGLFSRFNIYMFDQSPIFRSVRPTANRRSYDNIINEASESIKELLDEIFIQEIDFNLSESQWDKIEGRFDELVKESNDTSSTAVSSINRLALIYYRICMILSTFRHAEEGNLDLKIICSDQDFFTAGRIVKVYHSNIFEALSLIPKEAVKIDNKGANLLYSFLPTDREFTSREAKDIAEKNKVCKDRSVDTYLKKLVNLGLLDQPKNFGPYSKMRK